MTEPLVSVVIPVYNVEAYLDRCVSSVVSQTYRNLQIILVDDGSPDRCPQMCDSWAQRDSRIQVIHKLNAGLGMARNSGMDAAEGKYIFFFDSDDYVDATIVEKCVSSAEANDADAVIFGRWDLCEDMSMTQRPVAADCLVFHEDTICSELLPGMFTYDRGFGISAWGKMYHLDTFRQNNVRFFSEKEIISEDAYFALEFYPKAKTVTIVPECLYYYYKRSTSLSRQYRPDRQMKNDVFLEKSLECIRKYNLPEEVKISLQVRYHFYTIAAMKQIMMSCLSETQKKRLLWEVFSDRVLHNTLTPEVIRHEEKISLRVFFLLLKCRCYWMCYWLLKHRMRRP